MREGFVVAHSLGHLLMHDKPLIVDQTVRINLRDEVSSMGTRFEEIQANLFAAEILMPKTMVLRAAAQVADVSSARRDVLIPLAERFRVSREAMSYRLIDLGVLSA